MDSLGESSYEEGDRISSYFALTCADPEALLSLGRIVASDLPSSKLSALTGADDLDGYEITSEEECIDSEFYAIVTCAGGRA